MKPACQFDPPKLSGLARAELRAAKRQFPRTAYFFQSGIGEWRGYWSPYDGENGSRFRNFRSLKVASTLPSLPANAPRRRQFLRLSL